MSMFYFDPIIAISHGFSAAYVFEKIWWNIHQSPYAADEHFEDEGNLWRHFTYLEIHNFFDVTKPSGEIVNALGSRRTVRRAVDDLTKAGLLNRRSHTFGISLSINFDQLRKTVGEDSFTRYLSGDDYDET
jgi:hypothetical protein